ncbi:MAG: DUF2442 domain-containing protein [Xanthobacteraceae bacterium]
MALSDADVRRAEKRMQAHLQAQPRATAARYDRRGAKVIVSLSNGLELGVPVRLAQGLSGASAAELANIEISPTGLGLHWPRLDADLYLPALIEGIFGTHRWMARMLGKRGGEATSAAKKAAARANGKRGGRPRKEAHA